MNFAIRPDGSVISFDASMANRHGLVAGATGTGKTVTIKLLAEEFAKQGIPVFITDLKGDLTGFVQAGTTSEKLAERLEQIGAPTPEFQAFTTNFWDVLKQNGIPLRATISEMGPLLLSRLLGLNDTQTGVMYAIFKIADDQELLMLDYKDLQSLLAFVSENNKEFSAAYGNLQRQSIGAIQRKLLVLEQQGAHELFQEPALDIRDFLQRDVNGQGIINVLDAREIYHSPDLYSAFILYLLSELYETLPEVGDQPLPKMIFFFEEAHLLFQNASRVLLERIEQVVKLIRSKGVGIFFCTQNPRDIPDNVLAQLGSKIQHALRAYTPAEQRAVKAVAESFRGNPDFDVAEELMQLQIGEALISMLDDRGIPTPVEKAFILAPASQIGPVDQTTVYNNVRGSYLFGKYEKTFDSESAYEILTRKVEEMEAERQRELEEAEQAKAKDDSFLSNILKGRSKSDSPIERMVKNTMGSLGTQIGRSIYRGIFGNLLKK